MTCRSRGIAAVARFETTCGHSAARRRDYCDPTANQCGKLNVPKPSVAARVLPEAQPSTPEARSKFAPSDEAGYRVRVFISGAAPNRFSAARGAAFVQGFGRRPIEEVGRGCGAVVRKPSEKEPAGSGWRRWRARYGDLGAVPAPAQEPRQPLLTVAQRPAAKVLTVELQKVEGVQHGLGDGGAAVVQSIEDGDVHSAVAGAVREVGRPRSNPAADSPAP
jgi:hypothetical protein